MSVVANLLALAVAIGVAIYVWKHSQGTQRSLIGSVATGAVITGAIGFAAGFFGPILFTPESNQGPLLGIFLTGPIGFALGAIGGAIYWFWSGRRAMQQSS
jgi:hypothetical protein